MKKNIQILTLAILLTPVMAMAQQERAGNNNATTGNATSSAAKERVQASSTPQGRGEEMRSDVADYVQNLLNVANRNGGLGEEVRKIAQEQTEANERVREAKTKIEGRSNLTTFLVGTDYKNVGVIRSELTRTTARIEQLKREADKMIEWDKNLIGAEIARMEVEKKALEDFIKENEDKFSLFGWVARLFQ